MTWHRDLAREIRDEFRLAQRKRTEVATQTVELEPLGESIDGSRIFRYVARGVVARAPNGGRP